MAQRLEQLVFRHYARGALVPIIAVDALLLILYFGINAWSVARTEEALQREVQAVLPHLAERHATSLDEQLRQVERETAYLARAHELIFASPELYGIPGEAPQFEVAPNGALVQTNRLEWSSLYFLRAGELTAAQREKARFTAALDPLYRHMVRDVPNVVSAYLNTHDEMNRIYPFIQDAWKQYPAEFETTDFNFYYLADSTHNPQKKAVWTGVYLDPAGRGWMVSCVAPVYRGDFLEGVVGLDVTVENIVEHVLSLPLPWGASAFLADDSGMIIAMAPPVENLFGLHELKAHVYDTAVRREQLKPQDFNLLASPDRAVAERFAEIFASGAQLHTMDVHGRSTFMVQARVPITGWRLFIEAGQREVFHEARRVGDTSRLVGIGLVVLMLVFYVAFFTVLRRRARAMASVVAQPVAELTEAARRVATEATSAPVPASGIFEIDALTETFAQMSRELDARSRQLVESRVREQTQQKEAELAFARGMYESASGYLHNVGNSATRMNGSIVDLTDLLRGSEQFPRVFARLRAAVSSGADAAVLDRLEHVVIGKWLPRLRTTVEELRRIADSIQQTLRHQRTSYRGSHHLVASAPFDLFELTCRVVSEYVPQTDGITVELAHASRVEVRSHRHQIYNGLVNVVKNALDSMEGRGVLRVSVEALAEGGGRVTITDTGAGIEPAHRDRLFKPGFTTKESGTGLGLHSFAVFLSAHAGSITLESDGPGRGATARIEVRNV